MAFEYKVNFNINGKECILEEIGDLLKNKYETIENYNNCICINNKTEKWKELASIEIIETGYFFITILNRNERNNIIDTIKTILQKYDIDFKIEEV
jgi:hypothetical protein